MAVAWCLYALCKHPDALSKVRSEVLGVNKDIVSMEELNALPYLGAVTREVLRLYAPVRSTNRMANNDGFIPVGKPFVDRNGKTQNSIK
jgi:cytochrome P450